ncbi:hypothetical protein FBU31_002476, partial [Coemansia sp. 'formosensis']
MNVSFILVVFIAILSSFCVSALRVPERLRRMTPRTGVVAGVVVGSAAWLSLPLWQNAVVSVHPEELLPPPTPTQPLLADASQEPLVQPSEPEFDETLVARGDIDQNGIVLVYTVISALSLFAIVTILVGFGDGPRKVVPGVDVVGANRPATTNCAIDAPGFTGPAIVDRAIDTPSSTGPATVDRTIQCAGAEGSASAETAAGSEDTARDETATVETTDVEAADEHHIVDGTVDIVGEDTLLAGTTTQELAPNISNSEHANTPHASTVIYGASLPKQPHQADDDDDALASEELTAGAGTPQEPPQAASGDEWPDGAGTPQAPTAANCDSKHGDRTPRTDETGSSADPSLTGHDNVCPVAQVASGLSAQHTQATNYGRYRVLQILAGQSRTFYATVAKPRIGFSEYARGPSRLVNQSFKRSVILRDRPTEGLRAIKCSGSATQARYSEPATPAEPCASESCTDKQRRCRLFKRLTDSSTSHVAGLLAAVNASLFGHLDETTDPQHRPQFICIDSPMVVDEPPPMPETGVAGPSDRLIAAAEAVGPPLGLATTVEGGGEASFVDTHPQMPCVGTSMQPLVQAADPWIEKASIPTERES